jgi:CBS domain-containing protein
MTPNVVSIEEGVSLSKAVALMRRKRIKRLPVVREGIVVGIVSRADLVRVICKTLEAPAAIADDTTIEENILEELGRQRWLPRNSVGVAVENGVVLIDGCVSDIRERNAIGVLAATVPGVKRVENRLICVEANTGVLIYDPDDEVLQ